MAVVWAVHVAIALNLSILSVSPAEVSEFVGGTREIHFYQP
jgi:hypothetical protein